MSREVKKPRALKVGWWTFKLSAYRVGRRTHPRLHIGESAYVLPASELRRLGAWFYDAAAWAKSLEPEFDERNE